MWIRLTAIIGILWAFLLVPHVQAQGNNEVGIFAQYLHLKPASTGGIGGRLSLLVTSGIQLEFEGAKDFKSQAFNGQFQDPTGAIVTQKLTSDGYEFLAGPRFAVHGKVPVFVSIRGGAFRFTTHLPDLANFQPNTTPPGVPIGFRFKGTTGVLYPSAGLEFGSSSAGLRFDVGDEILFNYGQRNNLKIEVGPVFRF